MKNELFRFVQVRPVKKSVQDKSSKNLIYYPEDWKSQSNFLKSFVDKSGNLKDSELKETGVQKYNTVYDTTSEYEPINNFLDRIYSLILTGLPTTETVNKWSNHYLKIDIDSFIKSKIFNPYFIYLWDTILVRFFNKGISVPSIPTCSARIKGLKFILNMNIIETDLETLVKSTVVLPKISEGNQAKKNASGAKTLTQGHDEGKAILIKEYDSIENAEKEIRKFEKQQRSSLQKENTIKKTKKAGSVLPSWIIPNDKKKDLNKQTSSTLIKYNLDAGDINIIETINDLKNIKTQLYNQINQSQKKSKVKRIGKKYYNLNNLKTIAIPFLTADSSGESDLYTFDEDYEGSIGSVKPAGIGDLLLVEDQLLKYEMSEISYIENIMKTESKERIYRSLNRVETTSTTEKYTESEETKDLEQATRYEMQKEVQTTINQSNKFSAGVTVTGSYGPVNATAKADYAIENAESISDSSSSTFAQDITEKSTSRILETFKETFSQTITTETEETNTHGFDNSTGTEHAIGIYRYLDKYYKANLYNYGKRLFFEFIIPEPASFYIYSLGSNDLSDITAEEPISIDYIEIYDIIDETYLNLVKKHGATGVNPPPEEFIILGKTLSNREATDVSDEKDYRVTVKEDISITVPEGYSATTAYVNSSWVRYDSLNLEFNLKSNEATELIVQVADVEFHDPQTDEKTIKSLQSGSIPISIQATNLPSFIVNIEIKCQRTTEAFKAWQISVYEAILNAYSSQKAKYDSQLAAANNAAANEVVSIKTNDTQLIQKNELQKLSLELLTAQHFAHYNSTKSNTQSGFPELLIKEAMDEGEYIQFFEQAFEWDQMTFEYYPYFWSRKGEWANRILLEHSDKNFQAFLQAGAARVLVPVRQFYARSVHYYSKTGEPWEGGDAPLIHDELWDPIIEDLSDSATIENKRFISSWDYKLPTDLVILQEDNVLPTWESSET